MPRSISESPLDFEITKYCVVFFFCLNRVKCFQVYTMIKKKGHTFKGVGWGGANKP